MCYLKCCSWPLSGHWSAPLLGHKQPLFSYQQTVIAYPNVIGSHNTVISTMLIDIFMNTHFHVKATPPYCWAMPKPYGVWPVAGGGNTHVLVVLHCVQKNSNVKRGCLRLVFSETVLKLAQVSRVNMMDKILAGFIHEVGGGGWFQSTIEQLLILWESLSP